MCVFVPRIESSECTPSAARPFLEALPSYEALRKARREANDRQGRQTAARARVGLTDHTFGLFGRGYNKALAGQAREISWSHAMSKLANGFELQSRALTAEELEFARLIVSTLNLESPAEEIDPDAPLYGE